MKQSGRILSAVFSGITACMLGFALLFSIIIGFGGGLPDVAVPGLVWRFPETWSPVEIRVFLVALILLLFAFVIEAFRQLDRAGHRKRVRILLILGGVFLLMQLFVALGLHTIQNTDAFEVQDQALAIARGVHQTVDYTKSTYFAKYGNNDLYLIFCVQVFRACMFLHIHAYRTVFAVLNVAAVDLGILMTCRTVFLLKGPKVALKIFLLSVLNPLNVLLICWPYTCTLSLPLMMLSVWMTAALLKGKDGRAIHFAEILVIGLTAAVAYYFRPTAIFPVIALILCAGCACVRKIFFRTGQSSSGSEKSVYDSEKSSSGSEKNDFDSEKSSSGSEKSASGSEKSDGSSDKLSSGKGQPSTVSQISVFNKRGGRRIRTHRKLGKIVRKIIPAALAVLLMAGTSSAIRSASFRLDPVTDTEFPTVYWLLLGASDTGRVNSRDMNYNRRMYTVEENTETDIAAIREILRDRGMAGNIRHYLEKTGLTWSDGTAEYTTRSTESENSLPWLYQLLNGPGAGIVSLWCQAYRIILLFMAFAGVLIRLISGRKSGRAGASCSEKSECDAGASRSENSGYADGAAGFMFQVSVVTLLGGFIFYTFWEGKPVYSYPFLPFLILVSLPAWEKVCRMQEHGYRDAPSSAWTARRIVLAVLLAVTGVGLVQKYFVTAESGFYDVPSIVCDSTALADWVSVPEGRTLTQSFYPSEAFDTIRIRAKSAGSGNSEDQYRILVVAGDSEEDADSAAFQSEDVIADETVNADRIENGSITLVFQTVYPGKDEPFCIIITNLSAEGKSEDGLQSSVRFGTRLCYVMSEYKGDCFVKGKRHAGDLLIRVSHGNG